MKIEPLTHKDIATSSREKDDIITVRANLNLVAEIRVDKREVWRYTETIKYAKETCREMIVRKLYETVRENAHKALDGVIPLVRSNPCIGYAELDQLRKLFEPLISAGKELRDRPPDEKPDAKKN